MAETLNMTPVPGKKKTYELDPALQAILGMQGTSPYTPELTADVEAGIRRRSGELTGGRVAATQSDFLKRGGTGSSLEALTMNETRLAGDQAGEDQVLQFMLGAADRTAEDRRFKTGLAFQDYQDDVARAHEERLANQYMTQLAMQQAEERKRRRRTGIAQGLGTLAGAGVGAFLGGPAGASAGASAGSSLGFLFS